jgi:hypothetical protein
VIDLELDLTPPPPCPLYGESTSEEICIITLNNISVRKRAKKDLGSDYFMNIQYELGCVTSLRIHYVSVLKM